MKEPQLLKKPKNAKVHNPDLCRKCKSDYCVIVLDKDLRIPCVNLMERKKFRK